MEKIIALNNFPHIPLLFGSYNRNIKLLCNTFKVEIIARDNLRISGVKDAVEQTTQAVEVIQKHILRNGSITPEKVREIIASFTQEPAISKKREDNFPVQARTSGQKRYLQALQDYCVVFAIGPAGTGKTYLAVAMALDALAIGMINKIVLVRPAVEAGEKLGFLPGDYQAKVDPYLRPLYDSLCDLLGYDRLKKYMQKNIIEIAPLAYMRGRTLESAFIILDEAQNTTIPQMKMFLTRMGLHSRIVVTGDTTQIDLPNGCYSGLVHAQTILKHIKGVRFHYLSPKDIVRHPLVQEIVASYETETMEDDQH